MNTTGTDPESDYNNHQSPSNDDLIIKFFRQTAQEQDIANRYSMLLNQPYKSDVRFIFEMENNISLSAHKLILITGSPKFYAMFSDDKCNQTAYVKISNISSSTFQEMLNFVYGGCTNCKVTEWNAIAIMNAAHEYEIVNLENMICEYLIPKITVQNVCKLYEQSYFFKNQFALDCEKKLKQETSSILLTDAFLSTSVDTLKRILAFDEMAATECELFDAMLKWADLACQNSEVPSTAENKRNILKGAEKLIRFPRMDIDLFINCSEKVCSFFEDNEIGEIFVAITNPTHCRNTTLPYSTRQRIHPSTKHCDSDSESVSDEE